METGSPRGRNEDGWHPSPAKRILHELPSFRYLFGNTPHMSLFRKTKGLENRVALLGFGDPRNAWSTAAAAMDAGCKLVEIDLVDIEIANVARGVLLDYLCTYELNVADDEEDALFLWGVMYCSALPPAWLTRLRSFINKLLAAENNDRFRGFFGRECDADAVRKVLKAWEELGGAQLSAAAVQEKRRRHLALWCSIKRNPANQSTRRSVVKIDPDWEKSLGFMAIQIAGGFQGNSPKETKVCEKLGEEECDSYLKTGSIYPKIIPSMLQVPESDWAGNPTLLEPGDGAWHVWYGAAPFLSYLPMHCPRSKLKSSKKPLTTCCFEEFRVLASGRCRAEGRTNMRYFIGDALRLCVDGTLEHGHYSSVDTSNLSDNLGLINILVVCRPLLVPNLHAALFTTSMTWASSAATSFDEYFRIALGIDLQFAPTLLGLRLLNPPEFGRATPRPLMPSATADTFCWQPVVPLSAGGGSGGSDGSGKPVSSSSSSSSLVVAAPLPRLQDSPQLLKSLRSMVDICTHPPRKDVGRCGADLGTTLTVLHLLRGLSERVEGVLPSLDADQCGWEAVAAHTAAVCSISKESRKQWDALVCWCFGGLERKAPMLAKWKVEPSRDFQLDLDKGYHTAILQADLVVFAGDMGSAVRAVLNNNMNRVESMLKKDRFDVVGFDSKTLSARCLLPSNLNISQISAVGGGIVLTDVSNPGVQIPLLAIPVHPLAGMDITKCSVRPPLRLTASNWISAARLAAETNAHYAQCHHHHHHHLKVLKAVESVEKYTLTVEIVPSQDVKSSPKKASSVPTAAISVEFSDNKLSVWGDKVSRQVVLKTTTNPSSSLALTFSSAVSSKDSSRPRLCRKKAASDIGPNQTFEISFRKSSLWPGDDILLSQENKKINVDEGLPAAVLAEVGEHMGKMFSLAEAAHKMRSSGRSPAINRLFPTLGTLFKGGTLFDVKESIQSMFIFALQHGNGKLLMSLYDPEKPDESSLVVVIHSIVKLPDGRPLAHISCVDQDLALREYPTEQQKLPALKRFQNVMRSLGGGHKMVNTRCAAGEIDLFRKIFKRNSLMMAVPKWQKKLFEGAPEWVGTFLTPLYSGEFFIIFSEHPLSLLLLLLQYS